MNRTMTLIASGLVTAGIATALFLPGRQTANVVKSAGNAGSQLFGTVISGKKQPA
jgi:hypothetical protein